MKFKFFLIYRLVTPLKIFQFELNTVDIILFYFLFFSSKMLGIYLITYFDNCLNLV